MANFDQNRLWNHNATGGLELNWANQFLKMYEDDGVTARLTIDGDDDTLKSSADARDSITDGTSFNDPIDIVDNELIRGTITVDQNQTGAQTFEAELQYQFFDGSWNTLGTAQVSTFDAGQDSAFFLFENKTGYSEFRVNINPTNGNWSVNDYDVAQLKSETIINKGGASFLGGRLFLVDFAGQANGSSNVITNQVYLEGDGSGDFNVKVKG